MKLIPVKIFVYHLKSIPIKYLILTYNATNFEIKYQLTKLNKKFAWYFNSF